jgi:hypothetical protein
MPNTSQNSHVNYPLMNCLMQDLGLINKTYKKPETTLWWMWTLFQTSNSELLIKMTCTPKSTSFVNKQLSLESKTFNHSYFTQIVHHTCTRDQPDLKMGTDFANNELMALTSLNYSLIQGHISLNNFFPFIIETSTNLDKTKERHNLTLSCYSFTQTHWKSRLELDHCRYDIQKCIAAHRPIEDEFTAACFTSTIQYDTMKLHSPYLLQTIQDLFVALEAFLPLLKNIT